MNYTVRNGQYPGAPVKKIVIRHPIQGFGKKLDFEEIQHEFENIQSIPISQELENIFSTPPQSPRESKCPNAPKR